MFVGGVLGVLFVIVLRRRWLAVLTWFALYILVGLLTAGPWTGRVAVTLAFVLAVFTLLRSGVLSLVTAIFVSSLVSAVPMTIDLTAWYSGGTVCAASKVGRIVWPVAFAILRATCSDLISSSRSRP